jgi:hypothetical protein
MQNRQCSKFGNLTRIALKKTESQERKHPAESFSMSLEMIKSDSGPKYRIRKFSLKSTRKSSHNRKEVFLESTARLSIPESERHKPETVQRLARRVAGTANECKDKQFGNTESLRLEIFEPVSNLKPDRCMQSATDELPTT